jgi:ankyrin repeat protein
MKFDLTNPALLRCASLGNRLSLVEAALAAGTYREDVYEDAFVDVVSDGNTEVFKALYAVRERFDGFEDLKAEVLSSALRGGHREIAMVLIDDGAELKATPESLTMLMAAAEGGCVDLVTRSLDLGHDVNAVVSANSEVDTALSLASNPDVVRVLLDAKADVSLGPSLKTACAKSNPSSVKMLLDAGANADHTTKSWGTPLCSVLSAPKAAVSFDDEISVINLLLDAGARTRNIDPNGDSALHVWARATWSRPESIAVAKVLLERDPGLLDCRGAGGETPLMAAMKSKRRMHELEFLVEAGADVNAKDASGNSVLAISLMYNGSQAVFMREYRKFLATQQLLLAAGADPFDCDRLGRTAAMILFNPCTPDYTPPRGVRYMSVPEHLVNGFLIDIIGSILSRKSA